MRERAYTIDFKAPSISRDIRFCTEVTKPEYLRIFLTATPQNHRSPPA